MEEKKLFEKMKEYRFEFKHLTVLFVILFLFQLIISYINKSSIRSFLANTQEWYQKDSAEKLANLTTTTLELLLETISPKEKLDNDDLRRVVQSINIILNQQTLQHNIEDLCILVYRDGKVHAIDEGQVLFSFLRENPFLPATTKANHSTAISLYQNLYGDLKRREQIQSILTDKQTFHVFVPFIIRGEYFGALYMRNTPDFSLITNQIISNYDETSIIYLSLILLGLLAMYFISSYTVKERDEAQKLLFEENENNLKKQINYEKELLFTKRIYHTHHKAEKVMGFIKEDLRTIAPENINEVKYRVTKYSNFISRVIYDMKWYDPPIQTIRNSIFQTKINEVIKFIVDNIFLRVSSITNAYEIILELDDMLPKVPVNEFVVWEIIEPLIQNGIEHGGESDLKIRIKTFHDKTINKIFVLIVDNGKGIAPQLLEKNEEGIKKIFLENVTTKVSNIHNVGYGCYIAYEISKRCGWELDAGNEPDGGCHFIITISN